GPLQDVAAAIAKATQTPGPNPVPPQGGVAAQADAAAKGAAVPEREVMPGRTAYNTERICARSFWGSLSCTEKVVQQ
ncbi:hypothetical protein CH338_26795, partial [Rhodoplanes elegans]